MEERVVGTQSVSGKSSTKESHISSSSSQSSMDITDNLVSRLGVRLDVLDLYTTEMFEDELFLARRSMVPWRFRRNEKLSKRWKMLYQQYMCEEMLVSLDEQSLQENQNVSRVMLEIENTSSDLPSASDTCTPDPGPSFRVVGKAKIYPSRFKKTKSKPDDDSDSQVISATTFDTDASCHQDEGQSDTASAETGDENQSSSDPIESSIGDESPNTGYKLTSVKSTRWKNPSSANFSSDSGFEDYVARNTKKSTHPLSSTILKRIDDMSKIYEDRKSISDIVKARTLQRLQDLKVKVEINEKSNRTILAVRHPNPLHHVSKF